MQAQNGNTLTADSPSSRLRELGIELPAAPRPLGAYVEVSEAAGLLFVSGTLPVGHGATTYWGRLGADLSLVEGRNAARIASLNALAAAKEYLGDLDRLKKLVKLTVSIATTDRFTEHAAVADGASALFAQIFGPRAGHTRMVYGVQSLPKGAPVVVETIFAIHPAANHFNLETER